LSIYNIFSTKPSAILILLFYFLEPDRQMFRNSKERSLFNHNLNSWHSLLVLLLPVDKFKYLFWILQIILLNFETDKNASICVKMKMYSMYITRILIYFYIPVMARLDWKFYAAVLTRCHVYSSKYILDFILVCSFSVWCRIFKGSDNIHL
jgi:hypothetical protein